MPAQRCHHNDYASSAQLTILQDFAANGGQPSSLRPGLQRRLANVGADLDRQLSFLALGVCEQKLPRLPPEICRCASWSIYSLRNEVCTGLVDVRAGLQQDLPRGDVGG